MSRKISFVICCVAYFLILSGPQAHRTERRMIKHTFPISFPWMSGNFEGMSESVFVWILLADMLIDEMIDLESEMRCRESESGSSSYVWCVVRGEESRI